MSSQKKLVRMAVIGAPHGVRGEVRVKTFTADPLALGDYGPLLAEDGRIFEVKAIRPARGVVIVRFDGVGDRHAAEALAGIALHVDRSALPETGEPDEFYQADLVGLAVHDETGPVGKVTAIHDFGGGDIVEATIDGRPGVMIPFTAAAVPEVDVAAGHIRVDRVAAGLLPGEADRGDGA